MREQFARLLQMEQALDLLGQTLEEEKETDKVLNQIASEINLIAEQEPA